jgi:hypothetical protein
MAPQKAQLGLIPAEFWAGLLVGAFGTWLITTATGRRTAGIPYGYAKREYVKKVGELETKYVR